MSTEVLPEFSLPDCLVPLPIPTDDHRAGTDACRHSGPPVVDGQTALPQHDAFLDSSLRSHLRNRRGGNAQRQVPSMGTLVQH